MDTKETIGWLKIIRANLKNFPEISNGKKLEALTNAIDIAEAFEAFTDPNVSDKASYKKFEKVRNKSDQDLAVESAYKTGFKMGMLKVMSDSVRDKV